MWVDRHNVLPEDPLGDGRRCKRQLEDGLSSVDKSAGLKGGRQSPLPHHSQQLPLPPEPYRPSHRCGTDTLCPMMIRRGLNLSSNLLSLLNPSALLSPVLAWVAPTDDIAYAAAGAARRRHGLEPCGGAGGSSGWPAALGRCSVAHPLVPGAVLQGPVEIPELRDRSAFRQIFFETSLDCYT